MHYITGWSHLPGDDKFTWVTSSDQHYFVGWINPPFDGKFDGQKDNVDEGDGQDSQSHFSLSHKEWQKGESHQVGKLKDLKTQELFQLHDAGTTEKETYTFTHTHVTGTGINTLWNLSH